MIVVIQRLSRVLLFATPWTGVCQAFLSLTISLSLPKFLSIESVMLSNLKMIRNGKYKTKTKQYICSSEDI